MTHCPSAASLVASVLLLLDGPDLPAAVVAAIGADGVRQLELVALGALAHATGFSASCVRRLAVRVFEWRRLGFGMALPSPGSRSSGPAYNCFRSFRSGSSRGSTHSVSQEQVSRLRLRPQTAQSP